MSDIFISYAHEDQKSAQRLANPLEAQGWSVWWDTRLNAGEVWDEVIERELAAARCVFVLWSKASVQSRWVREEARKRLERRILVPVRIENVQLPLPFGGIQTGDLINWNGRSAHPDFKKLIRNVTEVLGPPPSPSPSPPPEGHEPKPVPPNSNDGSTSGKITVFLKNTWSTLDHYIGTIKRFFAVVARWRPRKWHLAMAGGVALLVVAVIYSSYGPPPPEEPSESQEVACYDQEAVDSLVSGLRRTKETYDKRLIDIIEYGNVRQNFVNKFYREVSQNQRSEECISQGLKIFRSLYDERAIDIIQWNDSRGRLWNIIHNLLKNKSETDEQIEQALTVIKQLYDQRLIDIIDFNETRKALSEKVIRKLHESPENTDR